MQEIFDTLAGVVAWVPLPPEYTVAIAIAMVLGSVSYVVSLRSVRIIILGIGAFMAVILLVVLLVAYIRQ